jgi:transposase
LSTKVHAATDALGNPVRFILTGGERNDITQIEPLLQGLRAGHVLADKGYDGQRAMDAIAASGAKPVVPRRTTTASWRTFDATIYKDRNASSAKSNTSAASQRATTNSPETMLASSISSPHSNVAAECKHYLGSGLID